MKLPEDLARIEEELAARAPARPRPELRGDVLGAVRRELGQASSRRLLRGGFWSFAAATAAAALLWVNFSMSAANNTDWSFAARDGGTEVRETAGRIRGLLPEMSEDDALRHAILLCAGSRVIMVPDPKRPAGGGFPQEMEEDW